MLHFPKHKVVSLKRPSQRMKCILRRYVAPHSSPLSNPIHSPHRGLYTDAAHRAKGTFSNSTGIPRRIPNTLGAQQNSRAVPAQTWSCFPPSITIFFPGRLLLDTLLCGARGTLSDIHRAFDNRSCTPQFLLPSSAGTDLFNCTKSCPQLPKGPCQLTTG